MNSFTEIITDELVASTKCNVKETLFNNNFMILYRFNVLDYFYIHVVFDLVMDL
jgi:hypothetical protein